MPELDRDGIERLKSLLKSGQATEVVRLLEAHITQEQADLTAWSVLGAAFFELQQWKSAEEAARQMLRLTPDSARHWSNLGTILRKQRHYDGAEEAQQRALSLDRSYRRAETELAKIEDERLAASEDDGWKVRIADGGFVGPLSEAELAELVTLGDIEPQWNARRGTGRVTTVREAIGDKVCHDAVLAREATTVARPERKAQEKNAFGGSISEAASDSSKVLLGALIAVIFVLGASLIWVVVSRDQPAATTDRPSAELAARPSTEPDDSPHSRSADSGAPSSSPEPTPRQMPAPAAERSGRSDQPPQQQTPSATAPAPPREVTSSGSGVRAKALDAIGDLQTAVEVGVNYRDYNNYVIEAKRELRRLQSEVPPGALWWTEIEAAMSDYEFAGDAWDWKFDGDGVRKFVYEGSPEFRLTMTKYGRNQLQNSLVQGWATQGIPEAGIPPTPARWMLWIDGIVQAAWASASQHIQRAASASRWSRSQ